MIARLKIVNRINKVVLPNTITGFAILFGYMALISIYKQEYVQAAWLIILAGILDFLDGRVARLINADSDFGVQLDSLADVINYGVVPSIMYYTVFFHQWDMVGILLSFLPTLFAAIRLARFNVLIDENLNKPGAFVGLPTTMAALMLSGYIIFANEISSDFGPPEPATLFVVLVAILMISNVPYEKENVLSPRDIIKYQRFIIASFIIASLVYMPAYAIFLWGLFYVLYGLLRSIFLALKGRL